MDFFIRFPVVKGLQAGKEYYIAMVPLNMLARMFDDEDDCVMPEYRAQRRLNEARVPIISKYITNNRDTYVFSALAASLDGDYTYLPNGDNNDIGILEVSMNAKFLINDGQHRKAAILSALKEDNSLGEETIPIVFYEDKGLVRSQQIFTDLNKNAVRTSNSISELYDSRDPIAIITRNVISSNAFLDTYTDKERDNLGKFSSNLFTLNTFYIANKYMLSKVKHDAIFDYEKRIKLYWDTIVDNMPQWNDLLTRDITKKELREDYISTKGIVIQAFGILGRDFINISSMVDKKIEKLKKIKVVNWKRNAQNWKNRAIRSDGRIISNKNAAILISNYLKIVMDIPLNEDDERIERKMK